MTEIFAVNPRLCLHHIQVLYSIQNSSDMLLWEDVCLCLNRIHILTCATALLNNCVIITPLLRHVHLDMCNCPF